MAEFDLKIVTPGGEFFSGKATAVSVPAYTGGLSIWAHHSKLVTSLVKGRITVTTQEEKRTGLCDGGMLSVADNTATILINQFEWEE